MRSANFSSEVLSPLASRLRVMKVPEVGWSDWGSVERILASAKQMGRLPEIAARLKDRSINDPTTTAAVAHFLNAFDGKRSGYSGKARYARPVPAEV
jgi:hypothetical protein